MAAAALGRESEEDVGFSFVDPRSREDVLCEKAARAAAILAPVCGNVALSVVASPVDRWRQRCRFSVAVHDNGGNGSTNNKNVVGFFLELDGKGAPMFISSFPLASEAVDATTRLLGVHLPDLPDVLMGLRTVGVHGTRAGPPPDGDVVVSLFYDCPLGAGWRAAAAELRDRCGLRGVVGRAKGERVVCGVDYVVETLRTADGRTYRYRQTEGHFSNPNSHIAELTLDWLCERSREIARSGDGDAATISGTTASVNPSDGPPPSDLLEMFCGNGNHTLALAGCGAYRNVLGVEINSALVAAATHNIEANGLGDRCHVVRAPSAKFVTKVLKTWAEASKRSGGGDSSGGVGVDGSGSSRDKVDDHDGASTDATGCSETPPLFRATHVVNGRAYRFRTVLVDPPRAGLDDATRSHIIRATAVRYTVTVVVLSDRITKTTDNNYRYISCNPDALRRDIEGLSATHAVQSGCIFDHFPRTPHLETAVHLVARPSWRDPG